MKRAGMALASLGSLAICIAMTLAVFTTFVGRRPVLYRVKGSVAQQHPLYILNPIRDRSPELPAEEVLKEISKGNCVAFTQQILGKTDPQCARDTELRILSWHLQAREDKAPGDVVLQFEVTRDFGTAGPHIDPYWFEMQQDERARWQVFNYERWFE